MSDFGPRTVGGRRRGSGREGESAQRVPKNMQSSSPKMMQTIKSQNWCSTCPQKSIQNSTPARDTNIDHSPQEKSMLKRSSPPNRRTHQPQTPVHISVPTIDTTANSQSRCGSRFRKAVQRSTTRDDDNIYTGKETKVNSK